MSRCGTGHCYSTTAPVTLQHAPYRQSRCSGARGQGLQTLGSVLLVHGVRHLDFSLGGEAAARFAGEVASHLSRPVAATKARSSIELKHVRGVMVALVHGGFLLLGSSPQLAWPGRWHHTDQQPRHVVVSSLTMCRALSVVHGGFLLHFHSMALAGEGGCSPRRPVAG